MNTLPKTKKPFAAWLATLPPNKKFDPSGQSSCFLASFARTRVKAGAPIYVNTEEYRINNNDIHALPTWAKNFTRATHALTQPSDSLWNTWPNFERGHMITVAKAKKLLEAM